jgi:type IV pilus assembly protein PilN
MKFDANLATKIYLNTRLLKFYLIAAVLLLVVISFINISNIAGRAGEAKRLTAEIAALEGKHKASGNGVTEKEYHALIEHIRFANEIIDKKTYNWLSLLNSIELVVPDGIAITSIEPDTKGKSLKLPGTARSFNHLRVFIERLEDSKFFTDVYLTSHSISTESKDITFVLTCKVTDK